MYSTLFVCVVGVITTFHRGTCFDRGSINLYKDESAKMSSQLVNQSRFDDVDVKVEVNVSGRNKTMPQLHQAHIKTDKEVLAKILGNPQSKEHVKAVKILRELVKTLKENKQKEKQSLLKNKTGVSFTTAHSRKPISKKISKAKAKHTVHSSSSSKKQKHFKQKVKKIKKNQVKLHKTLPNKSSHNVSEILHLIKPDETISESNMTVNEDNESEASALELRVNKSSSNEAHNKTSLSKHIKEAFTTALKEAIIETTKNAIQGKLLNGSNFHSNLNNNATLNNNTNNDINNPSSENSSNENLDDSKNIAKVDDDNEKIDDNQKIEKIDNENIDIVDNNNDKVTKKINSNNKNIEENANITMDKNANANENIDENANVNENMEQNTNANKNSDGNAYLNENMEQNTNFNENMEENANVNKNMEENTNVNKNIGENATVNKTIDENATVNKTIDENANINNTIDENATVNKSMETNANLNKTSDITLSKPEENLENQTFSKYNNNDEKSKEKDTEQVVPFTETTNVNVPVNNNTKVVTNIYKIIIHKNNSREMQGDEAQEYKGGKNFQDYTGSSIQSFTKIRNENESESDNGSANMEDEGNGDEEGEDEPEMEYKNANINRNKPSTMTGKTLTITFQENAQNLGGSSVTVKDPVLPGSSHLKTNVNRNESDDESMQKQQKTVTALVDDSLKLDNINTSEGLLHDVAALKPQKLFNDTLFEEAGIKANDKKQNKKDLSNVNLQNDKKSGTKPGLASLTTVKIDSNLSEDMDDNKNEGSGSGLSSGASIGNEFFFSKNERLSDAIEGHEIKPLNNYQGMNDKRDLITASFKSFANSILSHQPFTFMGKRPGNKYSLSDRQKGSKKESINVKPKKRNLKKARITHKLKPQKDLFESAEKRNELKLHKFDKKNVSLEDMSWNGDASRYGSLVFKRNIVSEDDDIIMESDESSERFHKELIALNGQPSIVEAKDKIFQKSLLPAYRKRSQIPFREKIIAKREVQHKKKQNKNISVANSTRSLTSSSDSEENGSGEASGQNETGSKRLGIPKKSAGSGAGPHKIGDKRLSIPFTDDLDTMGDLDEDVETLYNFGTEANMHTNPIFNSEVDPMLKKLAEKTKLEKHKQDQAKEQSAFVQQIDSGVSTISADEPKDALLTYKNEMELNNEERNPESYEEEGAINPAGATANEGETEISATGEMQLMDSASANPVAQMGEYAQPQGEARQSMMSEETEEENDAYPNGTEEHNIETTDDSEKNNNAFTPQGTYKAKTKAGQSDRNKAAKEVMMAEKLLKAMEQPIPKLQMKVRADQSQKEKTEEQEPLQRPSSRSDSSLKKTKTDLKQSIKLIPKKKTGAALHIVHLTAKASPKKTHQTKTLELKAKIVKAENKLKGVLMEGDEVKTAYSSPALNLRNKDDTVDDLSKRNNLKPKTKRHDSETQDFSTHNDIETEKAVATEADIPGVYAEKTDRKINRDFASDSVDTETIVDDVRKRTPKLKNDVSIDEGLDTSKRQNVKKTNPKRETLTTANDEEIEKLEKRQKYFAPDSDLQALRQHELQETYMPNGKLRGVDKNGFISSIKIVDSETSVNPQQNDEMLEYSEESKKADAEFDNEYNKK